MIERSTSEPARLTLGEAARLTGMPKAYLRELVEAGRLAVHLVPGNGQVKHRVSRTGLIEAGLIPNQVVPPRSDLSDLITLVREQSARIATLEDQRFQLGAQLGAALERIAALEDRTAQLPTSHAPDPDHGHLDAGSRAPQPISSNGLHATTAISVRDVLVRVGSAGAHRSAELGAGALRRGVRLLGRSRALSRR